MDPLPTLQPRPLLSLLLAFRQECEECDPLLRTCAEIWGRAELRGPSGSSGQLCCARAWDVLGCLWLVRGRTPPGLFSSWLFCTISVRQLGGQRWGDHSPHPLILEKSVPRGWEGKSALEEGLMSARRTSPPALAVGLGRVWGYLCSFPSLPYHNCCLPDLLGDLLMCIL